MSRLHRAACETFMCHLLSLPGPIDADLTDLLEKASDACTVHIYVFARWVMSCSQRAAGKAVCICAVVSPAGRGGRRGGRRQRQQRRGEEAGARRDQEPIQKGAPATRRARREERTRQGWFPVWCMVGATERLCPPPPSHPRYFICVCASALRSLLGIPSSRPFSFAPV